MLISYEQKIYSINKRFKMNKTKSVLLTLLVMMLWGSLFPVVKIGFIAYNIVTIGDILFFAGVRFSICGIIIMIYSYFHDKKSYANVKSEMPLILLSGLFAIILHYTFTYIGLSVADSSKTALLKKVGVLIYVGFSPIFIRSDKFSSQKIAGAILGFFGIVAINSTSGSFSMNMGDWLIIAASFCTVCSNIISKKLFATVNPLSSTGISQFFGGIVLLVAGKAMGGNMSFSLTLDSFVFVYMCIASILGYCLWFWLLKDGELSIMFIIQFAEPVFADIFGALLLGEDIFNIQFVVAFVLIFAGIYISNITPKKRKLNNGMYK